MKKTFLATLALAATALATPALADGPVKIGVLNCTVVGGTNFIVGSSRDIDCAYTSTSGRVREHYIGQVNRVGVDLGTATSVNVSWLVFAPTYKPGPGALAGGYVGASAEATVGVGLGANALIGGFGRSIILNPVSTQTQTGLNIAAGVAGLSLNKAPH